MHRLTENLLMLPLLCVLVACNDSAPANGIGNSGISLHTELGGSAEGYARACDSREFLFPADHGAHTAYRNEWWYITGNVQNKERKKFGFHATFFRIANAPQANAVQTDTPKETGFADQQSGDPVNARSAWSADQFYMGHFAISEDGDDQIKAHERFSRAAAGLAGAQVDPLRIWLDDWQLTAAIEDADELVWQLTLKEGGEFIDLTLRASKPVFLQGHDGLSQKSRERCNASYYYSIPRMRASGKIRSAGVVHEVTGTAWFDREWSSSALADNQSGWDWFSLQLADGRDLMVYQLRLRDGGIDPHSYAVEMRQDGSKRIIPIDAIRIEVDQWWRGSGGAQYPIAGTLHLADTGETIVYRPLIDDQEMQLTVRYWEGAIQLQDASGADIGHGYLELTGY